MILRWQPELDEFEESAVTRSNESRHKQDSSPSFRLSSTSALHSRLLILSSTIATSFKVIALAFPPMALSFSTFPPPSHSRHFHSSAPSSSCALFQTSNKNHDSTSTSSNNSKSLRRQLKLPEVAPDLITALAARSKNGFKKHASSTPVNVVGHRGALYAELENTRESFLQCAKWGCQAVELDVFVLPKDGSLVVFHGGGTDESPGLLDGYCLLGDSANIESSILDLTYEQSQSLAFNPNYAEFPCPQDKIASGVIPTLEQVLLDLKPYPNTDVKIELKGPGTVVPVIELVERLGMVNRCQYSSFDHARLAELRRLRPDKQRYPTGALFDVDLPVDFVQRAVHAGAGEIHLRYDTCTVQRIQAIHNANLRSMAWLRGPVGMAADARSKFWDMGNEDEACYQTLIETGVQQICCNRPDMLMRMMSLSSLQEKQREVASI